MSMASAQVLCPNSIVSYYTFDEEDKSETHYLDIVGDNNAKIIGDIPSTRGKIDESIQFSKNQNNYLEIPHSADYDFTSGSYSVEMVYRQNSGNGYMFGKNDQGPGYGFYTDRSKLKTVINGGWGPAGASDYGIWHHAVLTFSGNKMELFIDGLSRGKTTTNNPGPSSNGIKIGRSFSSTFPFNGDVDEFILYNDVLGLSSITDHYDRFKQGQSLCDLEIIYEEGDFNEDGSVDTLDLQWIFEGESNLHSFWADHSLQDPAKASFLLFLVGGK